MNARSRANLALVSPWPPQASGVADYAACLREAMEACGERIDVFSNAESVEGVLPIRSVDQAVDALRGYSRVLFQFGNHPFFHGYMLPLIASLGRSRCVIELHDLRLSHILPGINYSSASDFERAWLSANYSEPVEKVEDAHPVSDVVCKLASDVIVHSRYVEVRLRQLGVKNIHVVDLAYDIASMQARAPAQSGRAGPCRIGIFGTFQKNRQIPLAISALALLHRQGIDDWRLVLAGRPSDDFDAILGTIEAAGIADRVEIHEDLGSGEFLSLMQSVDVHVALRNPTYGETSGVVVQGMALGIPTIVSNVGWYSELPEFVVKIPEEGGLFELATELHAYLTDPKLRADVASKTRGFASTTYDVSSRAEEILSILLGKEENR